MKKWMKRTGIGLGSIVLALVLGVVAVYAASEVRFRRAYDDIAVSPLRAATDPAALERGRHLATAIGKCVDCHNGDLGGKVLFTFVPGKGAPFSRWIWDGRLADGRLLAGGRYILAVQGGAGAWTRAFLWNPTDP